MGLFDVLGGLFGIGPDAGGQNASIQALTSSQDAQNAQATTTGALAQQQAFLQALQSQNGVQNQSQVYNQLQAMANGQGPNPAQAALAQATGQNTANQAALMAGQRGANANAGLIARQAAMQGAANQQGSIGQAAVLQAQQSANALNAAGNLAGQQVNNLAGANQMYGNAALGQQQNIFSALNAQNNTNLGQQQGLNATANENRTFIRNGITGAIGAGPAIFAGGKSPAGGGSTSGDTMGGGGSGSGPTGVPMEAMKAQGGMINGPRSKAAQHLKGIKMAQGGEVPVLLSPGEKYIAPEEVSKVAKGQESPMAAGKTVPGTPKVPGNSYANDTVPATLKEGGIVIPNSIMQSKDPEAAALAFIRKHLSSKAK